MSEWQPIETVPKDGTRILVYFGSMGVREVFWSDAHDADFKLWCVDDNKHGPYYLRGWSETGERAPTHWMPLPEPPNV
jgi:hypothetical protein